MKLVLLVVPIEISTFGSAKYWYRGITPCLKTAFAKLYDDLEIELEFNIDGQPIFNSSSYEFWPILVFVHEMPYIK